MKGACQCFDADRPVPKLPPAFRPELRRVLQQQGIEALCEKHDLCQELQHTCSLCGQYVEHSMRMSQHIMRCHQNMYIQMQSQWADLLQRFRGYTKPSTCPHCKVKVKSLSQHKCPILGMRACLQQGETMQAVSRSEMRKRPGCPICTVSIIEVEGCQIVQQPPSHCFCEPRHAVETCQCQRQPKKKGGR